MKGRDVRVCVWEGKRVGMEERRFFQRQEAEGRLQVADNS
jgi:hypothetical protein